MIRFGVVGTNWISEEFIRVCEGIEDIVVTSVYSRTLETGKAFADKNHIDHVFTTYKSFLEDGKIDAIYIGSPNAMHFEHGKLALEAGKHVLCEKPITSHKRELDELIRLAKTNKLLLMEAVKIIAMPTYAVLKEHLKEIGAIRQVYFHYCQYSSRYDAYKRGELPNIFNPDFSTGSLMDLGIYSLYPCIDLFGLPKTVESKAYLLESGVDGNGSILFDYGTFQAVLVHSKINDSSLPCEIMGEEGSLQIDYISRPSCITLFKKGEEPKVLNEPLAYEAMQYEVEAFVTALKSGKNESELYSYKLSSEVMQMLDTIRSQCGIHFKADNPSNC